MHRGVPLFVGLAGLYAVLAPLLVRYLKRDIYDHLVSSSELPNIGLWATFTSLTSDEVPEL